tara:strand:- start:2057 stop:2731 length:675 start_codon:yes stop_codon:yes gene_type:complete
LNRENILIIAIDGPAGSGKSSTAKLLAEKLGFMYLNTGMMYRAVTFHFLTNKININEVNIQNEIKRIDIVVDFILNKQIVYLNGVNVVEYLNGENVANNVSLVSSNQYVREKLVSIQRDIAEKDSIVVDGRDIGTNVFPNAEFKFYLIADIEARANRRFLELSNSTSKTLNEIKEEILLRDNIDSNRKFSPLKKAIGAIEIDTTHLSLDEQVNEIFKIINKRGD